MKAFFSGVLKINKVMQAIAGIFLTFIIFLTTVDVLSRLVGYPVPGAVEIIAMCGGIVIGFTVPITSWMKGHISVDFVLEKLPLTGRKVIDIITRCVAIAMFLMVSWNLIKVGSEFMRANEVSGTLELPLYPVVYALGACFFMLSVVLFCDILKLVGGNHE